MREGNELLQAVKAYARENRVRSWLHLWETIGALVVTLIPTVLDIHWSLRLLSSVLAGMVLVRMFIIYHDFQHGAVLRNSKVATAIMDFFGILCLNPPNVWRRSHNYHHKHNAKIYGAAIGSFPVMTTEDFAKADPKTRRAYARVRSPLAIAMGYWTMFLNGMCIKSLKTNWRRHWDSGLAIGVHVVLAVTLAILDWRLLVFTFLLPLVIMQAMGAYLFYVQHNFPDVELRGRREWDYVHAALRSSSYFRMSKVMHWFTGNIGYHHVHHLNPRIPFYDLPKVMEAVPELQSPSETSWRPSDVAAALGLKLWDPERRRMVGWERA